MVPVKECSGQARRSRINLRPSVVERRHFFKSYQCIVSTRAARRLATTELDHRADLRCLLSGVDCHSESCEKLKVLVCNAFGCRHGPMVSRSRPCDDSHPFDVSIGVRRDRRPARSPNGSGKASQPKSSAGSTQLFYSGLELGALLGGPK